MKMRSLLCLPIVAFILNSSLASADSHDDSVRLLVYPTNGNAAKIVIGAQDYLVPISFEAGMGWDDVKDAYHIPHEYASLLEQGRITIYIGCAGASFTAHTHRAQ